MNIDLNFYWRLFLRRLPVMMFFILGCAGLGVITAMKLPATWSTSARLLVEDPQISQVQTFETNAVEQLDIIQQKLLTRATLIDIASRFDVYEDIRTLEPDEVVERMQKNTRIRRSAGRNQATTMLISFEGRSGQVVSDVVNEYVTLALEESVENRAVRAENTQEFFDQEVEGLGRELDLQSAAIALFKSENAEALPEDQSYRFSRQTLLQERLARLEQDRTTAQAQRREIVKIYETTGRVDQNADQRRRTPEQDQLVVARAELEHSRSLYSETHPQVIRRKALVARLEAIVAAQLESLSGDEEPAEGRRSPEEALLDATLTEVDGRLAYIDSSIATVADELAGLRLSITQSSTNESQLEKLERDYENIQTRYAAAIGNQNTARINARIEATAQGQRITAIENATVPQVPTGPNRVKIAVFGTMIGFMLAGAYFVLLEVLNRTVRHPSELLSRFNVTPITVIPYMESRSRRFFRRAGLVTATLVVLTCVPLGLWYIDANYLPLELVVQKGLARLGLG